MLETTTNPKRQLALQRPPEGHGERVARVLREFAPYEHKLQDWTRRCTLNAIWYLTDPFGAMRIANLGIEEELISELEGLHEEYKQLRMAKQTRRIA